MSTEAVKKFVGMALQDAELLNKLKAVVAERGEESSFEIVRMAEGYGCDFTATELVEYLAEGKTDLELSEAELETVTGGMTDVRTSLGRIKKTMSPGLMTKRATEPDN